MMELRRNAHFLILRSLTYFVATLSTIGGLFLYLNDIKFGWVWSPLVWLIIYAVIDIAFSSMFSGKYINGKDEKIITRVKLTAIMYGYFSLAAFGLAPGSYLILMYANDVIHHKSKLLVWSVIVAIGIPVCLMFWFGKKIDRLPQIDSNDA